jgi:hypothetical protein
MFVSPRVGEGLMEVSERKEDEGGGNFILALEVLSLQEKRKIEMLGKTQIY